MPSRKFSLLALCLLLCIAADPSRLHFLKPDDIDPVALLSGPPADDSEQHRKEIQTSLDWQEKRTPEQVAQCKRDEGMSAFGFDAISGDWFDAKNLPLTAKLIRQATGDAKFFIDEAKAHWNRVRPFNAIPAIHPCVDREQSPSFPSGHATRGMLWATILANLFPDEKDKLLAAGRQMGDDRVIGGAHYLSDVAAGQKLGTEIANKLLANSDFQKELAKAREECAAQTPRWRGKVDPRMPSLVDFDLPTLEARLVEHGFPASHARRILLDFYKSHGQPEFTGNSFGRRLLTWLGSNLEPRRSSIIAHVPSADGTQKLLIGFAGRGAVESVLMPGHRADRAAGCISSQIGCAMGCDFCASTRNGLERDLEAGEIVEQFLHLRARAALQSRRLTSLVFMGMGEPLLNLANVIAAIRRIAAPEMGALGWRQVTVSTVGIVPGIDALAAADLNVHLALSLHAADDATRSRIVPANRRYPVQEIMSAARRFADRSGRIPTIEYCLLADVNDSEAHALRLAEIMRGFRAHVNLIPYNAIGPGISGFVYARPSRERVTSFLSLLRGAGVVCHVRETRGDDVNAACGQLRVNSLVAG